MAVAALFMFSANILVTKAASNRVNLDLGFLISVSVNLVFCVALLAIQRSASDARFTWSGYATGIFLLAGVFSTYLGRFFLFESVARFGSAKSSIFQVSSPGFAAVIAWIFLSESLSLFALCGIVVTIAGLIAVANVPGTISNRRQAQAGSVSGAVSAAPQSSQAGFILRSSLLLGLASSFAYAIGSVLRGAGIRYWNEPVLGALLGAFAGFVLHTATSSGMRNLRTSIKAADRKGMCLYVVSGILTISAQVCSIWSMRYIPVALSNLITLCTPLLVIPGSLILFRKNEGLTFRTCFGAAMTMSGIAMILLGR
jgi:drug/metabolite transporter (DMT)-like permease